MDNQQKSLLTGIKPTGIPHIGNYLGAIKPAIELAKSFQNSYFFIADYHALNTVQNSEELRQSTLSIAATWLACGLDPSTTVLYRQSGVPEVFELSTIINSVTPKGWMNKAHAYKAAVDVNKAEGHDPDDGVSMGLYTYPILMAADILLYSATHIPVGKDQAQHVEITRDIAQRFNSAFNSKALTLPEALVQDSTELIIGIDGRKMSKSYGNIIPLFATKDDWRAVVNKIATDSRGVDEPKDLSNCLIFDIYKTIATPEQSNNLQGRLEAGGIGWGEVKNMLVDCLEEQFGGFRDKYQELMANPDKLEQILQDGEKKAGLVAKTKIGEVRRAIGSA